MQQARPIHRPSPSFHTPSAIRSTPADGARLERVMCIEDNPAIRRMIWLALVEIGRLELCNCADASDAIANLGDQLPDLILLDWQLPGPSGMETLQALREAADGLLPPVVIMASCCADSDSASTAGALQVIKKPLDAMQLASNLRQLYAGVAPRHLV